MWLLVAALISGASGACPSLPSLRSPAVAASFSAPLANGLFYENRYTDLAQLGARCQRMNKTALPSGSISEDYEVYYGDIPFPLPLVYNATPGQLGVSSRYMALFPEVTFPSVVVDFDLDASNTSYSALIEYLCWDVLGLSYVEVRISTRDPQPPAAYLDSLEARARALGVSWSGPLTQVNFTGCPAFQAEQQQQQPPPLQPPLLPAVRAALAAGGAAPLPPLGNASEDVLLPGTRPGLPRMALVFVQGAEVAPSAYLPFLRALQAAVTDFDLAIGAPDAPLLHTPDPVSIGYDVARTLQALQRSSGGLPLNDTAIVFAAHSLGGLVLQDWLALADFVTYQPAALALLGSYVTRSNRPSINASAGAASPTFRCPTLSLVGELDGLARVGRFAEAYWWQQGRAGLPPALQAAFPVLLVPGMSHGQYCHFEGPPPAEVAQYDLAPEVSEGAAQALAAGAVATFLASAVGGSPGAAAALAQAQAQAQAFFQPLLDSQLYEASYHLQPPCLDAPPGPWCRVGSPFSEHAQQLMTNTAGSNGSASFAFSAVVVDAMHPVADLHPIHLSNITNTCAAPTASCTLQASTVTENTYDPLYSQLDVALYPVSAHEVKVKMTSRQNGLLHAGQAGALFNATDSAPLCALINADTLAWALARAAPSTAARYLAKGLQLQFGADIIGFAGPQFTDGVLLWQLVNGTGGSGSGRPFVWVNSTSLPTPIPYFVKLAE